jgi:uncharacterized protein with HEPN domain
MKNSRTPSDYRLYLQEIVLHIQIIEEYTKGMTLEQFIHDRKTIDAVDANLRNIGEAMNVLSKIPQIKSKFYSYHIPWQDIASLRHTLSHEYFSRDPEIVWKNATSLLPKIKPQILKMLNEF